MDDVLSPTDFIQASRVLRLSSPLGEDQLLPERMTVDEGVNRLFEITISVRAKREAVKPEELIGKLVDVSLEIRQGEFDEGGVRRPFNGLVTNLSEGPPVTRGLRSYTLTIQPQFWLLSRRSDCRIWQNMTSMQVLETLLSEHGLPAAAYAPLHKVPPAREYSVQWNETDLDYLLRRFEEDGLFYWFEHEVGVHRIKVSDSKVAWSQPSPSAEGVDKVRLAQGSSDRNHINEWMRQFAFIPGQRAGADWNFETPSTVPLNVTPSLIQMPGAAKRELYEYPARISDVKEAEQAETFRMQAVEADHERVTGKSNVRFLEAGRRFTAYEEPHPEHQYEEHVITRITHWVVDRSYETTENDPEYRNEFEAIPSRVPLTPHRDTKRPRIEGAQVAIVAGPSGEEIHTDQYGRIKVWYPWDRRAKKDGSDTCWIRVNQAWGGGTWGAQVIPRIGMEVMVSFVDGDPDRPLVIGVVPNPKNPVPYDLPANKTRMVLRSNTHKGSGFNEMTFEDENGKENMFFHAQKDQTTRVLNDRTKRVDRHEVASIGGNRAVEVAGNQKHEIGGSVNTVVGGTGPMAMLAMAGVQALSGQTAGLLAQAAQIAGGGPGIASFATSLASSALGFLGAGGLSAREGVVSGPSPRADAGTALAGSGTGVGSDASNLFPLPGIMNTIVSSFKSDSVGIARAEQIGVSKVTNVGQISIENVGEAKKTLVGKEYQEKTGVYRLMQSDKDIDIHAKRVVQITAAKNIIVSEEKVVISTPGGMIEINDKGVIISGKTVRIITNSLDIESGLKSESCMKTSRGIVFGE
ncbi:type VI secretion system tip protein VgrG [Agrobacterium vitis]|uniref:Type VI secretion system tip protein VgrG n=1 Tax=Agrobacterium vitis TaxID=373 RepID=A0A368NYI0_AGRVI|nr:type VI secretion system tip protein TssI/VgrG [Agrobacterium vitis]KAA3511369.1 type VI secretion system tip protein VgrG [Agrobacterium vitis]KAA3519213.1 type VI secretion system tip protein VgrG [Agrobacterium vitis]MCF1480451.1 type VI secretion system tip protein VgrG [Agrobacterium vitis]MUZ99969.1 type VI secretion system tip protein VgrG [Agrobacterium vitis]MVA32855.1 type VI secretion system tip protein VgrG [Agrobacterium vitis]